MTGWGRCTPRVWAPSISGTCTSSTVPRTVVPAKATCAQPDSGFSTGIGALVSPYTTLTSNIRIGRHFHLNLYSYVEHDCRIGDFVTFAPAVRCNGNVTIADHVYVGSNAVIRQGVTIGKGAIVGMGAVVTRDVPPGETWAGNPARVLKT